MSDGIKDTLMGLISNTPANGEELEIGQYRTARGVWSVDDEYNNENNFSAKIDALAKNLAQHELTPFRVWHGIKGDDGKGRPLWGCIAYCHERSKHEIVS